MSDKLSFNLVFQWKPFEPIIQVERMDYIINVP